MDNYILNLIVNVALMAFAIFSVLELIYDRSIKGSLFCKIKQRGWLLIFFAVLSVGFNLYKDWKSDCKQYSSEKEKAKVDSMLQVSQSKLLQIQISAKDSIIKEVKNTYTNSIKASNEALAKYNLKISDSLHSVVSKLKLDAVHPQLTIAPCDVGKQPAFLTKDKGNDILNIQFTSSGGTSYHILLDYYILKEANNQFFVLQSNRILFGDKFITDNFTTTCFISLVPDLLSYSETVILVTGIFSKDPEGKIPVPFNSVFEFNFKENKYIGFDMDYEELKNKIVKPGR